MAKLEAFDRAKTLEEIERGETFTAPKGSAEAWQHASELCREHRQRTMQDASRLYFTRGDLAIIGAIAAVVALRIVLALLEQ